MSEKIKKKPRGRPIKKGQVLNPRAGGAGIQTTKEQRVHSIGTALFLNRKLLADKIKSIFSLTAEEMKYKFQDGLTPAIDLALLQVLTSALKNGDHQQLDFLLNRSVGKVKDEIDHTSSDGSMTPQFIFEEQKTNVNKD